VTRRGWTVAWQVAPAAAFYAFAFVAPLLILFAYSFWTASGFRIVPDPTLENYLTAATSPLYQAVFLRTVVVGLAVAAVVVPVAYVLAYLLRFVVERRGRVLLDIVLISMFSGYLVRIYAWRTILGKEGLLNSALLELGLIDEPLTFLVYSNLATAVTLIGMLIPLAVLPIYSSMANVSREHLEGAADLGARGFRLHRTILVPMVLPGLSTAFAIAFILAAGDFVVPALVGGTQGLLAGNLVADQFKGLGANWPLGAALSFMILVVMVAGYLIMTRLVRMASRW
jgi:spermidine/putrescine transport system permease protein